MFHLYWDVTSAPGFGIKGNPFQTKEKRCPVLEFSVGSMPADSNIFIKLAVHQSHLYILIGSSRWTSWLNCLLWITCDVMYWDRAKVTAFWWFSIETDLFQAVDIKTKMLEFGCRRELYPKVLKTVLLPAWHLLFFRFIDLFSNNKNSNWIVPFLNVA